MKLISYNSLKNSLTHSNISCLLDRHFIQNGYGLNKNNILNNVLKEYNLYYWDELGYSFYKKFNKLTKQQLLEIYLKLNLQNLEKL